MGFSGDEMSGKGERFENWDGTGGTLEWEGEAGAAKAKGLR